MNFESKHERWWVLNDIDEYMTITKLKKIIGEFPKGKKKIHLICVGLLKNPNRINE